MSGSNSLPPNAGAGLPPHDADRDEPLTLTVHSLPELGTQSAQEAARTRTGRLKMLGILLICAAPVIASYFSYYVWRPEARRNYGELIEPRPLPALQGTTVEGQVVELTALKDQWLFVSVADSACNAQCERHLFLQRQLREGLGKERDRVDWVWLRTGAGELSEALREGTSAATVLKVDEQALSTWLQPEQGKQLSDHLYVVDPMGNWMMRFPPDADPMLMKKDLERLLRASAFWDKEGRP